MSDRDAPTWLPWSAEAEQGTLGALLLDNDALSRVAGRIDAQSFWQPAHRLIFATICRLVSTGQPADVVTVHQALQDTQGADDWGGLPYLNALAQSVPSAAHVGRYAGIVADKALRRATLAALDRSRESVQQAETADHALDLVQTTLGGLQRVKAHAGPRRLGDLLTARAMHWQALQEGEASPGKATGIPALDRALGGGLKPGRVVVLAARPSIGKTSLAQQIGMTVAGQGEPVLMLSQEMQAGELADRATANLGGVSLEALTTGELQSGDWRTIADAADRASALPFYVDDQPALTLLDIRAKARDLKRREGLALVIIDYLQLCATTGTADKRHHQIEQISRGIKAMAKELGVCVLLLSQLKRSTESEPELDHLKESGAIEEDADVVILLHPMDSEANGSRSVLAKVAKNRGGRRGRLALSFTGRTQQWRETAASVPGRAA